MQVNQSQALIGITAIVELLTEHVEKYRPKKRIVIKNGQLDK